MGETFRRDPDLPGRMGGRWREPAMKPVEVVGARLDGEPRCTEHALQGATDPMHKLVGGGRLVWITEDKVDAESPIQCAVCEVVLGAG
ncbi:MAG: hypothetical protein JWL78_561 [Chloroflexi bacterium]|jgi:hypothetical protein|nr:hypothetical protein [Chloroflexota bacterium]MEA2615093.1 hypothetical protein [Chloroflexota bacterium]